MSDDVPQCDRHGQELEIRDTNSGFKAAYCKRCGRFYGRIDPAEIPKLQRKMHHETTSENPAES